MYLHDHVYLGMTTSKLNFKNSPSLFFFVIVFFCWFYGFS